jgi:hypothetical protein
VLPGKAGGADCDGKWEDGKHIGKENDQHKRKDVIGDGVEEDSNIFHNMRVPFSFAEASQQADKIAQNPGDNGSRQQ